MRWEELAALLERPLAEALPEFIEELATERAERAEQQMVGTLVGAWRLGPPLGRGGMGVVYLAERASSDFAQRAALKVVQSGIASAEVAARFARERSILARLDHPAIARLLDGGTTDDGRPWFAMELVDGESISAHCARRQLAIEARLRLLVDVAAAVEHAHRNFVVHGDLKPANVLVSDSGRPKLLDFGIAQLLEPGASDAGAVPGGRALGWTPDYAAPEQLRLEPLTTATDVYALGGLLDALVRGDAPAGPGLERRRDLEAIVARARAKDPGDRYSSVSAFAADLEHWLGLRPVAARAAGRGHRLGLLLRRHPATAAASGIAVLALSGALAALAGGQLAADRAARQAVEVREFLAGLFDLADPEVALGRPVSARDLVEHGVRRAERELVGQPELQAEILATLGRLAARLGQASTAREALGRAIALRAGRDGERSRIVAELRLALAGVHHEAGDEAAAESEARAALAIARQRRDPDEGLAAQSLSSLAVVLGGVGRFAEAEALAREALAIDERTADTALVAWDHNTLANLLRSTGRFDEAESESRHFLSLLAADPKARPLAVATGQFNLGVLLGDRERFADAISLLRSALATRETFYGTDHPLVAATRKELASVLARAGQRAAARTELERALEVTERTYGVASLRAANVRNSLAVLDFIAGDKAAAEAGFRQVLVVWEREWGPHNPSVITARLNLGCALRDLGQLPEAEKLLREGLTVRVADLGADHPDSATAMLYLAELLRRTARTNESARLARRALEIRRRVLGERSPGVAFALKALARTLRTAGDPGAALVLLEEAIAIYRERFPQGHPELDEAVADHGELEIVARGENPADLR